MVDVPLKSVVHLSGEQLLHLAIDVVAHTKHFRRCINLCCITTIAQNNTQLSIPASSFQGRPVRVKHDAYIMVKIGERKNVN